MVLICRPCGRGKWNAIRIVLPHTFEFEVQHDLFKPVVGRRFKLFGREMRICEIHP